MLSYRQPNLLLREGTVTVCTPQTHMGNVLQVHSCLLEHFEQKHKVQKDRHQCATNKLITTRHCKHGNQTLNAFDCTKQPKTALAAHDAWQSSTPFSVYASRMCE